MNTLALPLLACALLLAPRARPAQSTASLTSNPPQTDVLRLTRVPDGHFLVHLQQGGRERLINVKVTRNAAVCVASDDPQWLGLQGEFQLIGNGVFLVSLANQAHRATQFWVFQPDGRASVKEIPDRGERQEALPVKDGSLDRPAKTR